MLTANDVLIIVVCRHNNSIETPKTAKMPQDLPPIGGYEPVQYKVSPFQLLSRCSDIDWRSNLYTQRNLPARGFRPAVMLAAVAGVMTYGFWKVGRGIREQKYVAASKWALLFVDPFVVE